LRKLEKILASLREAGMSPQTPACIIENGTLKSQRQRIATLGTLMAAGFQGPAIIVVGEVVRFSSLKENSFQRKAA
jgi:uroporphyrin-III C-methyltransferase